MTEMSMTATHWTETEIPRDACTEAVEWVRTQPDLATAWRACERPDWMLWLVGRRIGGLAPAHQEWRNLALAAADCAALAEPYWREADRDVLAGGLATMRAWGHGVPRVTLADLRRARTADNVADNVALNADAFAAFAATAVSNARAADAHAAIRREAADIVRRYWPEPPRGEADND